MKPLLLVLSLLLLALLLAVAGHGAHHGLHSGPGASQHVLGLAPPRVVRSPAVARQHRLVRAVRGIKN
jgi:hypothetical protein